MHTLPHNSSSPAPRCIFNIQNQHQGYLHHSGAHMLSELGWCHSGQAGRSTHEEDAYSPHHWPRSDISWPKQYQAYPLGCCIWSCISRILSYTHGHFALWQYEGTTSSWGHHGLLGLQYGVLVASYKLLCIYTKRENPVNERKHQRQFLIYFLWWCLGMNFWKSEGSSPNVLL